MRCPEHAQRLLVSGSVNQSGNYSILWHAMTFRASYVLGAGSPAVGVIY